MKYTTITDLELKGNSIGGSGLTSLANAVRHSYTLRTISLGWNNLGQSESGLQAFFSALAENRSIEKIDLNNNELGPEVGQHLGACLKSNATLRTVDLKWNRLGNAGAKALLKGLQLNKILQILELAGNKVSDDLLRQANDLLARNKNGDFPSKDAGRGFQSLNSRVHTF